MSDPSDNPTNLLQRLKKRKIVQWTLGYLAGAFVVLQLMDALEGPLGLGQAVQQGILVLLVVGFPVTLVLAWYHGEQGRQRVSGPELLIIAGLLAVAGIGFRLLVSGDARSEEQAATTPIAAPEASIAVLPFDDLSPEGDQQYFVEGLSEEIINALTQIPDLKVSARTSTFLLAELGTDIATLANTLGVTNVLEGAVRKSGDRVRITAQLIEAETARSIGFKS